jgi:hypothetical protein
MVEMVYRLDYVGVDQCNQVEDKDLVRVGQGT